jgi:hypothetical protein
MLDFKLEHTDKFAEWRNNIVIYIERNIGIAEAIDFAQRFEARALLCRLVFDGGKEYYYILH